MSQNYFSVTPSQISDISHITREGVSLLGIADAAESVGMRSMGVRISFKQLIEDASMPVICHWGQNRFVLVYRIQKKKKCIIIHVADPASGLLKYTEK